MTPPGVPQRDDEDDLVSGFVSLIGVQAIVALSSEYDDTRVGELVAELIDRLMELIASGHDMAAAVDRFGDEGGVRIMTIHKSKGLEFEAVVVLAIEREMFWGKPDDERASYFLAMSRARAPALLHRVDPRRGLTHADYSTIAQWPKKEGSIA